MKNISKVVIFSWAFTIPWLHANEADEVLMAEIKDLRLLVQNQDLRIKRLETLLSSPKKKQVVVDRFSWQNPVLWKRIEKGMSRLQVEALLGSPTRVKKDIAHWWTIYYQGEKAGSGYISGNVVLNKDDRVEMINIPSM
ncbi:MAG: hypothetical protein P8Q37_01760 [Porticoccaceae bacterium]|nr:hypothetical protein [Porticoccaceae bacterium]MDG1473598.1 hypothetical protein [Porticoccaceae bacterium]